MCGGIIKIIQVYERYDGANKLQIYHFTVVDLVTWPLNGSEAEGDLVLIQTSLLLLCKSSCSYAN